MFNKEESSILLKCTGYGAAAGGIWCALVFVYSLLAEVWNCSIGCVFDCEMHQVNSGSPYIFGLIICLLIGIVVGLARAISMRSARLDEERAKREKDESAAAKKQRRQWASEVKKNALEIEKTCNNNQSSIKSIVSGKYQLSKQFDLILNEVMNVIELQGKIASIAQEMTAKGIDAQ